VDQSVLVPAAPPGDWFILVYGEAVSQPAGFTLLARNATVIVSLVSPDRMPGDVKVIGTPLSSIPPVVEPVELVIEGAGFRDVSSVELVTPSGLVVARATDPLVVNVESSERLRAKILDKFDYRGPLSVRVTNQDHTVGLLDSAIESVG